MLVMTSIRVGIIGTGFTAKLRAQKFQQDDRAQLIAVAGHRTQKTQEFATEFGAMAHNSWPELVERADLDLIAVCNINRDRGEIVRRVLEAGKHAIVEYPLALDAMEAEELVARAAMQNKLLHVEHIELLGGLHIALKQHLPLIGEPFYVRYSTINPQRPAPEKWTYHQELFGFPLVGALSRLHRLTDVFGKVATVSCQNRYWETGEYYRACLCQAQLRFTSGVLAEVTYGKGDVFWHPSRLMEVHGDQGTLIFDGDQGQLIRDQEITPLEVGTRRGLFLKDTEMVLDYLVEGTPLYVSPQASLYTLKVANAAKDAAQTGQTLELLRNGFEA